MHLSCRFPTIFRLFSSKSTSPKASTNVFEVILKSFNNSSELAFVGICLEGEKQNCNKSIESKRKRHVVYMKHRKRKKES